MDLLTIPDKRTVLDALFRRVQELDDGALPGDAPQSPRQLNTAWRSGWATSVERALILHRMLSQEKIAVEWVLTGADAELETLTGFDTMLLRAEFDGEPLWLDPGCRTCVPGEVATTSMGQVAIGGADAIPRGPGRLERRTRVEGERIEVEFHATDAAARWIRESLADTDDAHRAARLAALLGVKGARLDHVEGLKEGPIHLLFSGGAVPHDPFDGRPTPWEGGLVDRVDAADAAVH